MTTMTREEAVTILTSILHDRAERCDEPQPCPDCELEAEAIAALSGPLKLPHSLLADVAIDTGISPAKLHAALNRLGLRVEVDNG